MKKGFRERYVSYYSGVLHPIYEQYKLKKDAKYAVQRYCSLDTLSEYSIKPDHKDYDLFECGVLVGDVSLEKSIETIISKKNSLRNNSVSVGDVMKIYRACKQYFFFVDPVGLQRLKEF